MVYLLNLRENPDEDGMTHIKISKGLDIPIVGKPEGNVQPLTLSGESQPDKTPPKIALDLDPFEDIRFNLLAKQGDIVKIGQPLVEDKGTPNRYFVSPAAGTISEVRRGLKRRLLSIVIDVDSDEAYHDIGALDANKATKEQILQKFMEGGIFACIRSRPFNILAKPDRPPRSIFVKAIESAPFTPPAELQVAGHEEEFQSGLNALKKLTQGPVHLFYRKDSPSRAFTEAKNVEKHTAEGPHPISSYSIFINHLDPISKAEDVIWTVSARDVVLMGHLLKTGRTLPERVVSIAGPGIIEGRTGYFKARAGFPIASLISNRIKKGLLRFVTGDPLTGRKVEQEDFLGFYDTAFCVIPENTRRQFLHFCRLGLNKYSFSKAYWSGHVKNQEKEYDFTTSLHGEPRAFIDPSLYDAVMPLPIHTMQLVKAVMSEDFDLAEELGLLQVDSEDFALPTFVCPSKMEMTSIMKQGLKTHSTEMLA